MKTCLTVHDIYPRPHSAVSSLLENLDPIFSPLFLAHSVHKPSECIPMPEFLVGGGGIAVLLGMRLCF